jgi:hypothetical protein
VCLALTLTGFIGTHRAQAQTPQAQPASMCAGLPATAFNDASARWRYEATHNLECAIDMIDRVLKASPGDAGNVTISRADLQELRALTVSAQAAAAALH